MNLLDKIFDSYTLLINKGVSSDSLSHDKFKLRGLNFMTLIWIPALSLAPAFCYHNAEWIYGSIMFTSIAILLSIFYFNKIGNFKLSTIIYLLVINFNVLLVNVIFEFNFGTFLFLFPLFACFSFLFPLPKNKNILALIFMLMFLLHGMSFLLISLYPSENLVLDSNPLFMQLNYGFAFGLTLMIVLMYSILQSQQKLELDSRILINEQQKLLLEETLKDRNVLLSEIHHRTKNNLAIVSSMLNLQRNQIENVELQNILLDCSNRVHSMATVHQKLYEKENFTKIDLKEYLEELIRDLQKTIFPTDKEVQLILEIDSFNITSDKAIPCALIINELITNSIKHAFQNQGGKLEIKIKKIGNQILLMIHDNGPGFNYNAEKNHLSLGMTLIEALTEQLNGQYEYNTKHGTTFNLSFKLI